MQVHFVSKGLMVPGQPPKPCAFGTLCDALKTTQVTEVDDASNADSLPLLEQGQKSQCEKIVWYF